MDVINALTNVTDNAVILMPIDADSFPKRFPLRDACCRSDYESRLMASSQRRMARAFLVLTGLDR